MVATCARYFRKAVQVMKPYTIQIDGYGHATIYDNDTDDVIGYYDSEG